MTRTCGDAGGVAKSGAPCKSSLMLSLVNGLCLQHDPERAEQRRAFYKAGGTASQNARRANREARKAAAAAVEAATAEAPAPLLETLDGLVKLAAAVAARTFAGTMETRAAEAITKTINVQRQNLRDRDLLPQVLGLRADVRAWRKENKRSAQHGNNVRMVR